MNRIVFFVLSLLIIPVLGFAQTIEYTPFEGNRYYDDRCPLTKEFGKPYQWPLKTFPPTWRRQDYKQLDESYGLVYWPGETVNVYLRESGRTADKVICENVLSDGELEATQMSGNYWRISIPDTGQQAPYLEIYRVHALNGEDTLASRGLIVSLPWSNVQGRGDPDGPEARHGQVWHEWHNGIVAPPTYMCYLYGKNPHDESIYPMSERPWSDLHGTGLRELYWWPRYEGNVASVNDKTLHTSHAYHDPTFEWNVWWTYYARGASDWEGEWQWGPFSKMSAEALDKEGGQGDRYAQSMMYGQARSITTALPNGLMLYQWYFRDLAKTYQHMINVTGDPFLFHLSDGYGHWQWVNRRSAEGIEGIGLANLYYKRCLHHSLDTSWLSRSKSFGSFMHAEEDKFFEDNERLNDFVGQFMFNDIRINNIGTIATAANRGYHDLTGKTVGFYGRLNSAMDRHEGNGLLRDFTHTDSVFYKRIIPNRWTGGDYMHTPLGHGSEDYYEHIRWYRGYGIKGAIAGSLFPIKGYGGGYNQYNNGCSMPGHPNFEVAYTCGDDCNIDEKKYRHAIRTNIKDDDMPVTREDVLAYRRHELWEKLPMYYEPDGNLESWKVANTGGWAASWTEDESHTWNSMILLGQQVLEIPDRKKPYGGVMIIDSNNEEDRRNNTQFDTEESFNDYICALMDSLGTATYARDDREGNIPADVPRIYAPRHDGGSEVYLMAKIGGSTVKVPYTGMADQKPSGSNFQEFARQIKSTYKSEYGHAWPIQTTGGFAATAWESSKGIFLFVESPIGDNGELHVPRSGSVKIHIPGLYGGDVNVVDMLGELPDPHKLPAGQYQVDENWVHINLDWQYGDARVYWIDTGKELPRVALKKKINEPDTLLENGQDTCRFIVEREQAEEEIIIHYTLSGRNISADDIAGPLKGTVVMPAGKLSDTLTVVPVDDTIPEGEETIRVSIHPDNQAAYYLRNASASVLVQEEVQLLKPSRNQSFTILDTLALAAFASDEKGPVAAVDFYYNDSLICTAAHEPFECQWALPPAGEWNIYAQATDGEGNRERTPSIRVRISDNISLGYVQPQSGALFDKGSKVTVKPDLTGIPDVNKLTVYRGREILGTVEEAPFEYTIENLKTGKYLISCEVEFGSGNSTVKIPELPFGVISNPMDPSQAGFIVADYWNNVFGSDLDNLPVNTDPEQSKLLTDFSSREGLGDHYGTRIAGYIIVPETGKYTFWIEGDDNVELWLENPETGNARRIAYHNGHTSLTQWNKYPTQQSGPLYLEGGRKYYMEALHREGGGGDHISVKWELPDGAVESPIPGDRLLPLYDSNYIQKEPVVLIHSPDDKMSFYEGASGEISIEIEAFDRHGAVDTIRLFRDRNLLNQWIQPSGASVNYVQGPLNQGIYGFVCNAVDTSAAVGLSDTVFVEVKNNLTVRMQELYTDTVSPGALFEFHASATSVTGEIEKVSFYQIHPGGSEEKLGTGSLSGRDVYAIKAYDLQAGTQHFYAIATNNQGISESSDTVKLVVATPVGINARATFPEVSIYPKSLEGEALTIEMSHIGGGSDATVLITGVRGRVIYHKAMTGKQTVVPYSTFPVPGVYLVTVKKGKGIYRDKLVVF